MPGCTQTPLPYLYGLTHLESISPLLSLHGEIWHIPLVKFKHLTIFRDQNQVGPAPQAPIRPLLPPRARLGVGAAVWMGGGKLGRRLAPQQWKAGLRPPLLLTSRGPEPELPWDTNRNRASGARGLAGPVAEAHRAPRASSRTEALDTSLQDQALPSRAKLRKESFWNGEGPWEPLPGKTHRGRDKPGSGWGPGQRLVLMPARPPPASPTPGWRRARL